MKIGQIDNTAALTQVAAERNAKPSKAGQPAEAEASAQVQLSPTASLLSEGGNVEFDSAKVDRIAQAIRDGKFQVNHEAIADKLIANAQELLGRTPH
jgi:negative regulator of flagellin synthesis FlgM